jgi:hypothetical protein
VELPVMECRDKDRSNSKATHDVPLLHLPFSRPPKRWILVFFFSNINTHNSPPRDAKPTNR